MIISRFVLFKSKKEEYLYEKDCVSKKMLYFCRQ